MKRTLLLCYLAVTSLMLSGCDLDLGSSYDPVKKTLYIDYYQEPCNDTTTDLCYRTRFENEQSFALMTKPLEGFESLQWGKRYQVSAEVERTSTGKGVSYNFISIDAVEDMDPVINNFVLTVEMSSGILENNATDGSASRWLLAKQKSFSCSPGDCAAINNALATNKKIQLNFRVNNNELMLQEVKCSATADVFDAECEGVQDRSWDIAPFKSDCGAYLPAWCHVYKQTTEASSNFKLLPIEITNFSDETYQWGKQFELRVRSTVQADSLTAAVFVEQQDVVDVYAVFRTVMRIQANDLTKSSQGELNYLGVTFDCGANSTCNSFDRIIDDVNSNDAVGRKERIVIVEAENKNVSGNTSAAGNSSADAILIVERLLCDAAVADFKLDCADQYDEVYWPAR